MMEIAKVVAKKWCFPEKHHFVEVKLSYSYVNGKSNRVPRIDVRGNHGMCEIYIGHAAVEFLALLVDECQKLLK